MAPYMGRGGREEALAPPTEKRGEARGEGKRYRRVEDNKMSSYAVSH